MFVSCTQISTPELKHGICKLDKFHSSTVPLYFRKKTRKTILNIYKPKTNCLVCTGKYESYEQALEVGLLEALKLIE